MTIKFLLPSFRCRRSSDGISRTQGPHHVAQKFISTILPPKSARARFLPFCSVNTAAGRAEGVAAGSNFSIQPVRGGALFAAETVSARVYVLESAPIMAIIARPVARAARAPVFLIPDSKPN